MCSKKINIIHVLACLDVGGAELLVLDFLKRLNRDKYAPTVCSLKKNGSIEKDFKTAGIPVLVADKKDGIDLSLPFKLARIFCREKIDIVHTHNAAPWLYGGIASRILNSKILFHTEHANLYGHDKKMMLAERYLSRITSRVIVDADKVGDFLVNTEKINRNKIELVFNGVDIDKYSNIKINRVSKRLELGITPEQKLIGIVARLSRVKDHKNLLDAHSAIIKIIPEARLMIIGDGELRVELENYSEAKGLKNHVIFLGTRSDIPELLKILDVFVLCSTSEGLPVTILEAMAAGLPIVATNVGGNPEVIVDNHSGFLVPAKNPQKLAETIISILNDETLACDFGKNGQTRCRELFSLDGMVKKYSELYESALKQ